MAKNQIRKHSGRRRFSIAPTIEVEKKKHMTDRQYYLRLLSESFDRELSEEEQNRLSYYMAEHEAPREFEELFKRIRDSSIQQELFSEIAPALNQHLSDAKKIEIQRLLESAMQKQQDSLSNRDCLLYTSPSPRDATLSRMPSSA